MKVVSVNIGDRKVVKWQSKEVETGIYKYPVEGRITLGETDVVGDKVMDRVHHAGIDQAVYLYGANHYPFWKEHYPEATYDYGALGENITLKNLDEHQIRIGNQYKIDDAVIEISAPRVPCFKLGIRLGSQQSLRDFINNSYCGMYARVLKLGSVGKDAEMIMVKELENNPTLAEAHQILSPQFKDKAKAEHLLECKELSERFKDSVKKKFRIK